MSEAGAERPDAAPLESEEQARVDIYGLISRFFYAPPDSKLLAEVAHVRAPAEQTGDAAQDNPLSHAWQRLQGACSTSYPAVVRQEYDGLFVGVGKAAVSLYLSGYAEPNSPDRYIVRLRGQLGAWGLARRDGAFEVEDHISGVCDVMRWLIEGARPLTEQRMFYQEFLYSGAIGFLAAAQKSPSAAFYQEVVEYARQFFEIEKVAFEMD